MNDSASDTSEKTAPERADHGRTTVFEVVTALSMTVGRGAAAQFAIDEADVASGDVVVDVGCGPGTAVRAAAHHGASVIGVDPSPLMLRLGRWISAVRRQGHVTLLAGRAESLPVASASATVVWALSSLHHWDDQAAGLAEAQRAMVPGGRIVLVERQVRPGARGHAAHGLTRAAADEIAGELRSIGFEDVEVTQRRAGRRDLVVIRGRAVPAPTATGSGGEP